MAILERDHQLEMLAAAYARCRAELTGSCLIVCGEAGVGKSTLVRAFVESMALDSSTADAPVFQTGCEALFTPRPFGPLVDLSERFPPSVSRALSQGPTYNALFPELLAFFKASARPCLFVIEDVHWADAGTLDLLRYIGRRLRDLPLLLVITYREEGLDDHHLLRIALGDMPSATTRRTVLLPLSRSAVDDLAHAACRDGAEVFAKTGGNPFYVTEVLAGDDRVIPASVRDAVRSTLARLSPVARSVAEWVSMFPGRVEHPLLQRVCVPLAPAIEAGVRSGLLRGLAGATSFRHEIARNAVYEAMPEHRRIERHRVIYQALSSGPHGDHMTAAQRVHHAQAAGLYEQVGELAPEAARHAALSGAHREAARLFGIALEWNATFAPPALAELLENYAHECMLTNQHRHAIESREQACTIRRALGDMLKVGVNLRWLARLHWLDHGSGPTTYRLARQAIDVLSAVPAHRELALAYGTLSHLCLVSEDMEGAQLWGLRAIELAEQLDDPQALSHALNNVGAARLRLSDDAVAWERLARSLEIALAHDLEQDAARAYNNLLILCVIHHAFTPGLRYAEEGIDYCEAKGLDIYTVRIRIRRAFAHIVMGRWDLADLDLDAVARRHTPSAMEATTHEFVASILAMRRGRAGATLRLRAAVSALQASRVEIWFISTAAALAEAAWLDDHPGDLNDIAEPALARLAAIGDRWRSAELASWLLRAGARVEPSIFDLSSRDLPRPYLLEARGDWRAAAAAWGQLECPYDRALALVAGDDDALLEALASFEALGARPAADQVRKRLAQRGMRGVPRGPQPRTRGDPLGLTTREREVFELARDGLTSADIAQRLRRSERTIEHHVAAVYRKLGVNTRTELMARHPMQAQRAAIAK